MDKRAGESGADGVCRRQSPRPLGIFSAVLWPWVLAGITVMLAMAVVALECQRLGGSPFGGLAAETPPWWQSPIVLATLVAGMIATATLVVLGHNHAAAASTMAASLGDEDARSPWRQLTAQGLADGFALWDGRDYLLQHSGFFDHYLANLSDWRNPSTRQLAAALVDRGATLPAPAEERAQAIERLTESLTDTQTLHELQLADGQTFLVRSIRLDDMRRATLFTNVTRMRHPHDGQVSYKGFRQLFEQSPSPKLLLDALSRPLAVNRAFVALLGYSMDVLAGLSWQDLLHPDEPADTPEWAAGPHRLLTAAGTSVRVVIGAQQLPDDASMAPGRVLITLEDVTARWEADERQRLQTALLERMGQAVLGVDRSGRVAYGNAAARTLFQWSHSVLPGTPIDRLLGPTIRGAIDEGAAELETEGVTWGGTAFPALVSIARTGESSPLPGGAVLVVADLTPRRALDLQLMHSARLATLGEMAASIAHEFNQCLHVIRLASEAARLDIADGRIEPRQLTQRADNILTQVDRLTEMVTHMRSISRRESQEKRPFHPQAAVDSALRMVEPLLKMDGIRVVRQGRLDGLMALGHQVRLEQVLLNLLNNGGDAIRERFRNSGDTGGTITITCTADDSRLRIAVRDDGTGIANVIGDHIFEPFVTTKDGGKGLGLGLSISRGICTEMGGSLSFGNVEGGAEFVIELPVADVADAIDVLPLPATSAEWENSDDSDDSDEDPGDDRRVLLVDDEALSVMMVSEFLHRQGYHVDTAYDGQEAYELCLRHVYYVVITDIRMPRMNGRELIAKLEELQPGTPVIVVTGHLKEENAADLGANVVALLAKPFQLQQLREQLLQLDRTDDQEKNGV
ncbi:MAG TPA: response regulator [Magnetospirillum sp.]|nr:response regulator [Magnetospirillum sp.]